MRRQLQPRLSGVLLETGTAAREPTGVAARMAARNPSHLFGPNPALVLSFLTGSLDPRITATGGVNGTRVNSAGVIVAASCPRFDHDSVTLAIRGILIEPSRENLLLNSLIDGTNLTTQNVTVAASAHTLTFYGTGSIALSGAFVGTLNGAGAYPSRATLTFTPSAGSLTLTVSGTVQFAQLEVGAFSTSFIPTAGTSVVRTEDIATTPLSISGNGASIVCQYQINTAMVSLVPVLCQIDDGTANNQIAVYAVTNGSGLYSGGAFSRLSGVNGINTNAGTSNAVGTILNVAAAFAVGNSAVSSGGSAVVSSASANIPGALSTLRVGRSASVVTGVRHVRSISVWAVRLSDAVLQARSA